MCANHMDSVGFRRDLLNMGLKMGGKGFLWSTLFGFLMFGCISALAHDPNDPTTNVNLSPFQKLRSAYECLQKIPERCQGTWRLTEDGWVNVTRTDGDGYCSSPDGCADPTRAVLLCVSLVYSPYKFRNHATVHDINATINHGCTYGFNGTTLISSSAWKMHESKTTTFVAALAAWIFISFRSM